MSKSDPSTNSLHLGPRQSRPASPAGARRSSTDWRRIRHWLLILWVGIGFVALDGLDVLTRVDTVGVNIDGRSWIERLKQLVFLSPHLLAIAALLACMTMRRWLALSVLCLLFTLTVIDLSVLLILGHPASLTHVSMLNSAVGHASDAIEEHARAIAWAVGLSALYFLPMFVAVVRRRAKGSRRAALVFTGCTALLFTMYLGLLVSKGEDVLIGFPRGFAYGFGSLGLVINDAIAELDPQPNLATDGPAAPLARTIVMVIDESIAYAEMARMPLDTQGVIDYGRAYSAANCSATANYVLRKGGWRRAESAERIAVSRIESLFSLARRAGFATVYVDNQRVLRDPSTKNYIDGTELAAVDHVIESQETRPWRDLRSLAAITALIGRQGGSLRGRPVFVLINKAGTHFPYRGSLPPGMATGDRMTDYRRSLARSTQHFMVELSRIVDDRTLIFYTSDHGQDFAGRNTHCKAGAEISPDEYAVPMMLITHDQALVERLARSRERFLNRLTHLEFSESVRNALGYSTAGIGSVFKENDPPLPHAFCGLYGAPTAIFGVLPRCLPLEAAPDSPLGAATRGPQHNPGT
ncbi:MAG: sulfatase-like hydrolase/transferase [Burkholderiaceae bacterium]